MCYVTPEVHYLLLLTARDQLEKDYLRHWCAYKVCWLYTAAELIQNGGKVRVPSDPVQKITWQAFMLHDRGTLNRQAANFLMAFLKTKITIKFILKTIILHCLSRSPFESIQYQLIFMPGLSLAFDLLIYMYNSRLCDSLSLINTTLWDPLPVQLKPPMIICPWHAQGHTAKLFLSLLVWSIELWNPLKSSVMTSIPWHATRTHSKVVLSQ